MGMDICSGIEVFIVVDELKASITSHHKKRTNVPLRAFQNIQCNRQCIHLVVTPNDAPKTFSSTFFQFFLCIFCSFSSIPEVFKYSQLNCVSMILIFMVKNPNELRNAKRKKENIPLTSFLLQP